MDTTSKSAICCSGYAAERVHEDLSFPSRQPIVKGYVLKSLLRQPRIFCRQSPGATRPNLRRPFRRPRIPLPRHRTIVRLLQIRQGFPRRRLQIPKRLNPVRRHLETEAANGHYGQNHRHHRQGKYAQPGGQLRHLAFRQRHRRMQRPRHNVMPCQKRHRYRKDKQHRELCQ